MKKVAVVTYYIESENNARAYVAYQYFKKNNYDVKVFYANYSHLKREFREFNNVDFIPISVNKYRRNLSIQRIVSLIAFSIKAMFTIGRASSFDLVYVVTPPNFLGFLMTILGRMKKIRVVIDIIDFWPEALPMSNSIKLALNLTVGILWKGFRTYSIKRSDYIITESNYFSKKLCLDNRLNAKVIYLCKESGGTPSDIVNREGTNVIHIGYLGSINYITDFESLIQISKGIKDRGGDVIVEIIGQGERADWLINRLEGQGIALQFYGAIYDDNRKHEILRRCHFGFNGYKNDTEVALSYKSMDYLSYGLPLLNSAKYDTWNLVESYGAGVNYNQADLDSICDKIMAFSANDYNIMKKAAFDLYRSFFSWESYSAEMDNVMQKVIEKV